MKGNQIKNNTEQSFEGSMQQLLPDISNRLELQGECRVHEVQFIKVNYPKAIILTIFLTATVIGLLMLKYFKSFRTKVWYSPSSSGEATHVYVQNEDQVDDIEPIQREGDQLFFYFKKLRYIYTKKRYYPVGFDYEQNFDVYFSKKHREKGLDTVLVEKHLRQYGQNRHPVEIDSYPQYLFDVLLKPFFILQYIVCAAFFVERLEAFAISTLVFSLLTTTINYIIAYRGFLKIKAMAEKESNIKVLRDGKRVVLKNYELVPGDLIDPEGEVPCDCIVMEGDIYVNEASLTGQDVPIAKFPALSVAELKNDNRWLFQGAKVLEKKNQVLALVVNIGFSSKRGRIIRKIRTKVTKTSEIFIRAMMFLLEVFIVGIIIYLATINLPLSKDIDTLFVGFRFIDFLGWSFPPVYPIYFNFLYSFALVRLRMHNVIGIQPEKTVQASNLKTMCFDKTGTLTRNEVQVHDVYKITENGDIQNINQYKHEKQNEFLLKLFATCHTTKEIDGQFMGDQVDLRMFLYSEYKMKHSEKKDVKFLATNEEKNINLEVIRINQFESKFQSMSVLVRDVNEKKLYAFVKGAPEKIHRSAVKQIKDYDRTVASLSLGGLRTIGCGYREVKQDEIQKYLEGPRDIFSENIIALSLIAFQNKLKHDTRETLDKLVAADIEPKIITGDNIFIAIQTATTAGMIQRSDSVIIMQGKKQPVDQFVPGEPRKFKANILTRLQRETTQQQVILTEDGDYLTQTHPIAIDNDFLKLDPQPKLIDNMRIFARISPQNKALIVQKYKQKVEEQYRAKPVCERLFGPLRTKVGMCGDGANDLMAIRMADIGVGINDSDASYGATFTIVDMLDIDYLIRDSKATTANIIEIFRYFAVISIIKIPISLLMMTDTSYSNLFQILFFNFTSTVIYPFIQAVSFPTDKNTAKRPNGNLFGPINQLRIWLSVIIITGGLCAGFFYFTSTDEFIPNQRPSAGPNNGWNPVTHSATIIFLMIQIPFSFYIIFVYISKPWKVRLYKNYVLFIWIILNISTSIAFFYITPHLQVNFGVKPISTINASILLGIIGVATLLCAIVNQFINIAEFDDDDK